MPGRAGWEEDCETGLARDSESSDEIILLDSSADSPEIILSGTSESDTDVEESRIVGVSLGLIIRVLL